MSRVFLTAALASLVMVTALVSAQTTQSKSGLIRGSVFDESLALMPGVPVTLGSLEKTEVKRAVTNQKGEYSIEAPAGSYELTAQVPGFRVSITPVRVKD